MNLDELDRLRQVSLLSALVIILVVGVINVREVNSLAIDKQGEQLRLERNVALLDDFRLIVDHVVFVEIFTVL